MPVKNAVSAVALLVLVKADVAFAGCSWSGSFGCVNEEKYECPDIQGYLTCEGQEAGCAGASNMYATCVLQAWGDEQVSEFYDYIGQDEDTEWCIPSTMTACDFVNCYLMDYFCTGISSESDCEIASSNEIRDTDAYIPFADPVCFPPSPQPTDAPTAQPTQGAVDAAAAVGTFLPAAAVAIGVAAGF